jgi:hypothetical protein
MITNPHLVNEFRTNLKRLKKQKASREAIALTERGIEYLKDPPPGWPEDYALKAIIKRIRSEKGSSNEALGLVDLLGPVIGASCLRAGARSANQELWADATALGRIVAMNAVLRTWDPASANPKGLKGWVALLVERTVRNLVRDDMRANSVPVKGKPGTRRFVRTVSLDAPVADDATTTLADVVPDTAPGPAEACERAENHYQGTCLRGVLRESGHSETDAELDKPRPPLTRAAELLTRITPELITAMRATEAGAITSRPMRAAA